MKPEKTRKSKAAQSQAEPSPAPVQKAKPAPKSAEKPTEPAAPKATPKAAPKRTRKTVLSRKTPGDKPPAQASPSPTVLPSPPIQQARPAAPKTKPRKTRAPRKLAAPIPPILLEGDHPKTAPTPQGPGKRFAAAIIPPPPQLAPERAEIPPPAPPTYPPPPELPVSYGTQRVFLAARDPYCLFVSWDIDLAQSQRFAAASPTGTLVIRLHREFAEGEVALEVHVQPEHRDRFINIPTGSRTLAAELGYYDRANSHWQRISVSKPATAPPDASAAEVSVIDPPLPEMFAIFPEPVRVVAAPLRHEPPPPPPPPEQPSPDRQRHREEPVWFSQTPVPATPEFAFEAPTAPAPRTEPPPPAPRHAPAQSHVPALAPELEIVWDVPQWTPAQAEALTEIISREMRYWQEGSIELQELIERHLGHAPTSPTPRDSMLRRAARALGLPGAREEALSSETAIPQPEAPAPKPFWMRVNAELVVYGATEPGARVTIGGRAIKLRPDGTFSYRFALPDGDYQLPIHAVSNDRQHERAADLRFSRASLYRGEVRAERQDPALRQPAPENIS